MIGYLKNLGSLKEEAWKYDRTQLYELGIKNMIPDDLVRYHDIVKIVNGKMAGEYILVENLDFFNEEIFIINGKTIDKDISPVVIPLFNTIFTNLKLTDIEMEILRKFEEYNHVQYTNNALSEDAYLYQEHDDERSKRYSLLLEQLYEELSNLKIELKDDRFNFFENEE